MLGKSAQGFPWGDMPFFLALARAGNPARAAADLGMDRTTMVRRLDKLEASLGRQLFDRVPGAYNLTPHGRTVFAAAERAEQELSAAGNPHLSRFPLGRVRISMSEQILSGFAHTFAEMAEKLPEILLELATTDRFVDLSRFEADVVLRLSRKPPSGLHAVDLGAVKFALYRPAGTPAPARFITRPGEEEVPGYVRDLLPGAQQVMSVDGMVSVCAMVRAGMGAGILPRFLGAHDPQLAEIGPIAVGPVFHLFAACLPEQRNLQRIRRVLAYLRKNMQPAESGPAASGSKAPEHRA